MFGMLVTTLPYVPGYRVKKILGIAYGVTIRARGLGGALVASVETLVGGEIRAFTEELIRARLECIKRMVEMAKKMGANAVIGVDFETSSFQGLFIFAAYGTAVVLEKVGDVEIELKDDILLKGVELAPLEEAPKEAEVTYQRVLELFESLYGRGRGEYMLKKKLRELMERGMSEEEALRAIYEGRA